MTEVCRDFGISRKTGLPTFLQVHFLYTPRDFSGKFQLRERGDKPLSMSAAECRPGGRGACWAIAPAFDGFRR
jgi:hypothetical protein